MNSKPRKLPNHEELLVDYAERLKNHRKGRRALHIRLSRLARHNRRNSHIRIAENSFDKLVKLYEGQMFRLSNSDLVFVATAMPDSAVDDIVLKLRFMFREDPFIELAEKEDHETAFCVDYNIEKKYREFLTATRDLFRDCEELRIKAAEAAKPSAGLNKTKAPVGPLKPLSPSDLGRLEEAIDGTDLSTLIRKQAICAIIPDCPPSPIFYERFISISGLRQSYLPNVDLRSDRWLFQRLVESLDRRMLAALPDYLRNVPVATSINTTISTILSDQFLAFDAEYRQLKKKKTLLFEFQATDVLADISAYLFARDFLRVNNYKVCIDGLDPLTFSMIFQDQMQPDLEKVVWSDDLVNKLKGDWRAHFADAVARVGASRVVLCRCDSLDAIDFGQRMGIHMFQGQVIDELLNSNSAPRAAANF